MLRKDGLGRDFPLKMNKWKVWVMGTLYVTLLITNAGQTAGPVFSYSALSTYKIELGSIATLKPSLLEKLSRIHLSISSYSILETFSACFVHSDESYSSSSSVKHRL
jgi:succinylglutamate desuccinylase